jgi:hypothetical protein
MDKVPAEEKSQDGNCKNPFKFHDKKSLHFPACWSLRHDLNELVMSKSGGKCLVKRPESWDKDGRKDSYQKIIKTAKLEKLLRDCQSSASGQGQGSGVP